MGNALVGFDARYYARPESISKRARSTTRTSLLRLCSSEVEASLGASPPGLQPHSNMVWRPGESSPRASGIINATAPIRICDLGGWTDTRVARLGFVLNIAVRPVVEAGARASAQNERPRVVIDAANYGERYASNLVARLAGAAESQPAPS
jgi:hypothetical protein